MNIYNPLTGYPIQVGGATFNKLVQQGVLGPYSAEQLGGGCPLRDDKNVHIRDYMEIFSGEGAAEIAKYLDEIGFSAADKAEFNKLVKFFQEKTALIDDMEEEDDQETCDQIYYAAEKAKVRMEALKDKYKEGFERAMEAEGHPSPPKMPGVVKARKNTSGLPILSKRPAYKATWRRGG